MSEINRNDESQVRILLSRRCAQFCCADGHPNGAVSLAAGCGVARESRAARARSDEFTGAHHVADYRGGYPGRPRQSGPYHCCVSSLGGHSPIDVVHGDRSGRTHLHPSDFLRISHRRRNGICSARKRRHAERVSRRWAATGGDLGHGAQFWWSDDRIYCRWDG